MGRDIGLALVLVLAGSQEAQGITYSPFPSRSTSAVATQSTTTSEEEGCPAGWVNAHNEGCFTFLGEETKLSWIDATLACEQAGGYLAEPQSLEQMEFLAGIAGLESDFTGIRNWWIGLTDFSHEGIWVWTHSIQEINEVFWGEGSPEESPGNSLDCAYLALQENNQLVWKDMACGDHTANGEKIAPLCQRGDPQPDGSTSTSTIKSTTTTTTEQATTTSDEVYGCPLGWSQFNSSCYWLVFDLVDWVEALNGCQQIHPAAHFASSGSASENDYIANLHIASSNEYYFWLGGTDSEVEGNWTWTDGTPFDFTNWYPGQGSDGTGHNCLVVNSGDYHTGYWHDLGCFDSHPYICEINFDN